MSYLGRKYNDSTFSNASANTVPSSLAVKEFVQSNVITTPVQNRILATSEVLVAADQGHAVEPGNNDLTFTLPDASEIALGIENLFYIKSKAFTGLNIIPPLNSTIDFTHTQDNPFLMIYSLQTYGFYSDDGINYFSY